jgi:FAD/FMN-containing dehydrogenase
LQTKLTDIVQVIDDERLLSGFAGNKRLGLSIKPRGLVKPADAAEAQSLIQWAITTGTPLIPVSSGAPHYRDDTAPSVPEALIVDLSGMKKVLNINPKHRMAVIEPGVTYGELAEALKPQGLRLAAAFAPKQNKSVIASLLEREPRLNAMHQWAFTDPLRCMEVIWGDGNRMYTGEAGGGPMDLQAQWAEDKWQVEPVGPMMLDFYRILTGAQGTMGIVTWASVRCELLHKAYKAFAVSSDDLDALLKFMQKTVYFRFSDDLFILNGAQLAALMADSGRETSAVQAILPRWIAMAGIGGRDLLPEMRVAQQEADIKDIAEQYGLRMEPAAGGIPADAIMGKASVPCEGVYWKEKPKGAFLDVFFLTTLPQIDSFVKKMYACADEEGFDRSLISAYIQPVHCGSAYHLEFTLPYDPVNAAETDRAAALYKKASACFAAMNAYYSRPYGVWADLQMNKNAANLKALEELKHIFDPRFILNPGKLCLSNKRNLTQERRIG